MFLVTQCSKKNGRAVKLGWKESLVCNYWRVFKNTLLISSRQLNSMFLLEISMSRSLNKFGLLCVISLLTACGAGTTDSTNAQVVLASASNQRGLAKISSVASGERRAYDIVWSQGQLIGTPTSAGLNNFQFSSTEVRLPDVSVVYDKEGPAAQLYRLYQAAFGRTPDVAGFGFWKDALENRGVTLGQIADEFLKSDESKGVYGTQNDDSVFINRLCQNVLHRPADAAGANYWLNSLKTGAKRNDALLGFADSKENREATAPTIEKGMAFAEPGIAYIPVSNATGPGDVIAGANVEVDGTTSTDANGDVLRYSWTFTTKPLGSVAALSTPALAKTRFVADVPGTYEIALRVSDATSQSYSPAKIVVIARGIVADSGTYMCSTIDAALAQLLYSAGHTYLDRNKNGTVCDAADLAYERSPTVTPIADSGTYKCSTISHATAVLLYMQGHTYLDRDHDGKPCEATDVKLETPVVVPPVTTPTYPSNGMCWVNGYTRKNGTYVKGYWRHC